ncbi:MAG: acyl-CoA dehydrogenase, partial [Pirellulaceae bacterium]|nr:acyl-CoA dehydrogenase [Pirellulaceae bacterium]
AWPYARWLAGQRLLPRPAARLPDLPGPLAGHARFAIGQLQSAALEISATMRKHQLKLADRQCRMSELSGRLQLLVVMLCASLYAGRQADELVRDAADVLCRELAAKLTGRRPSDGDFRAMTALGEKIAERGFAGTEGLDAGEILMPYER